MLLPETNTRPWETPVDHPLERPNPPDFSASPRQPQPLGIPSCSPDSPAPFVSSLFLPVWSQPPLLSPARPTRATTANPPTRPAAALAERAAPTGQETPPVKRGDGSGGDRARVRARAPRVAATRRAAAARTRAGVEVEPVPRAGPTAAEPAVMQALQQRRHRRDRQRRNRRNRHRPRSRSHRARSGDRRGHRRQLLRLPRRQLRGQPLYDAGNIHPRRGHRHRSVERRGDRRSDHRRHRQGRLAALLDHGAVRLRRGARCAT